MNRHWLMLAIVGASILVGLVKRCSPERHPHSIYYERKGRLR